MTGNTALQGGGLVIQAGWAPILRATLDVNGWLGHTDYYNLLQCPDVTSLNYHVELRFQKQQ